MRIRFLRIRFVVALLAATAIAPSAAFAQYAIGGAVGGALLGSTVAGPAGAAVGAAVGATVGAASEFPVPAPPAHPKRKVVGTAHGIKVGDALPRKLAIHPMPRGQYSYAVIDHTRVLVNPRTRVVVKIIKED